MSVNVRPYGQSLDSPKSVHLYASTAADTAYIRASAILVPDGGNAQMFFQSVGSSVTIYGTLCPELQAIDPKQQASVTWVSIAVLTPGTILSGESGFTALKIVFAGAGELHMASR